MMLSLAMREKYCGKDRDAQSHESELGQVETPQPEAEPEPIEQIKPDDSEKQKKPEIEFFEK